MDKNMNTMAITNEDKLTLLNAITKISARDNLTDEDKIKLFDVLVKTCIESENANKITSKTLLKMYDSGKTMKEVCDEFNITNKDFYEITGKTLYDIRATNAKRNTEGYRQGIEERKTKIKKIILQSSRHFKGNLKDADVVKALNIAPSTYSRYKKELKRELIGA